jgi:hypothetical protein
MKNNTSSRCEATQGILAKTALNQLRKSEHPLGRPLALCLMFESTENQLMAASVFDLAIALDAALHIPSESLLAAIRIQWWADALAKTTEQHVPLLACLQSQYNSRDNFLSQLLDIISEWQTACHYETRDSSEGWVAVWRLIALHLGHKTAVDQAAVIGRELYFATLGQKYGGLVVNIDIKTLRKNDREEERTLLYLSACLSRKLQGGQNLNLNATRKSHYAGLDDPLLVWRILVWYIFGPPK